MNKLRDMIGYSLTAASLAVFSGVVLSANAMQPLDDQQLGQETGQAAFYTNYIGPTDLSNPNNGTNGNPNNVGFFSLGLNGTISLNANINRLQLGCGGVNGPGCDIDLSGVRLTGTQAGPSGTFADSDATMQNPFIQLAIQNPTNLSTRHVIGVAFGAQNANALLSVGQNAPTITSTYQTTCGTAAGINCSRPSPTTSNLLSNSVTYQPGIPGGTQTTITASGPNDLGCGFNGATQCRTQTVVTNQGGETGINSLSGNFQVAVANIKIPTTISGTGVADGSGDLFLKAKNNNTTGNTVGNSAGGDNFQPENGVCDAYGHCGIGGTDAASGNKSGTYFQYSSGSRMTGLSLGSLLLDLTNIGGLAGLIGNGYAQIKPQNLIDVHNLVASSNASQGLLLSLNSTQITWPQVGSAGIYSFPTTSQFLNSSTTAGTISAQSLAAQQGWWLSVPQAIVGGTASSPLNTAPVVLNGLAQVTSALGSPGVALPSLNLQQIPVPNCYSGMKFC